MSSPNQTCFVWTSSAKPAMAVFALLKTEVGFDQQWSCRLPELPLLFLKEISRSPNAVPFY